MARNCEPRWVSGSSFLQDECSWAFALVPQAVSAYLRTLALTQTRAQFSGEGATSPLTLSTWRGLDVRTKGRRKERWKEREFA